MNNIEIHWITPTWTWSLQNWGDCRNRMKEDEKGWKCPAWNSENSLSIAQHCYWPSFLQHLSASFSQSSPWKKVQTLRPIVTIAEGGISHGVHVSPASLPYVFLMLMLLALSGNKLTGSSDKYSSNMACSWAPFCTPVGYNIEWCDQRRQK